jgi:RHS repeat-associated protein
MRTSVTRYGRTLGAVVLLLGLLAALPAPAASRIYYVHNDHLGTPQVLTDESGNVVWQADYEPFGRASETTALISQGLRFPGQYLDAETGLHYNYFRDYDPGTGRYLEGDPSGLGGGIDLFIYVDNSPLNKVDTKGLFGGFTMLLNEFKREPYRIPRSDAMAMETLADRLVLGGSMATAASISVVPELVPLMAEARGAVVGICRVAAEAARKHPEVIRVGLLSGSLCAVDPADIDRANPSRLNSRPEEGLEKDLSQMEQIERASRLSRQQYTHLPRE